jgi:hypothetical protein
MTTAAIRDGFDKARVVGRANINRLERADSDGSRVMAQAGPRRSRQQRPTVRPAARWPATMSVHPVIRDRYHNPTIRRLAQWERQRARLEITSLQG